MDAVTLVAAVPVITSSAVTIARAWMRARGERQRVKECSRQDYIRSLPPGSRIIDLGKNGLVIEMGPGPALPVPPPAKERSHVG